jgi:hypothetical protein
VEVGEDDVVDVGKLVTAFSEPLAEVSTDVVGGDAGIDKCEFVGVVVGEDVGVVSTLELLVSEYDAVHIGYPHVVH